MCCVTMLSQLCLCVCVCQGADGRRARLQDVIRLYEIILQNLQEIPQLAGLEGDLEIRSSVQAQISAYKGFR